MIVLISAWILLETIRLSDHDAISELHGRKNESVRISRTIKAVRSCGRPNFPKPCTSMYFNSGCQTVRVVWDYSALLIHSYFVIHHHHHRCPSRSDDDASGASGVTSDQTPMHRCVLTSGRLRQQLGWSCSLSWLGV